MVGATGRRAVRGVAGTLGGQCGKFAVQATALVVLGRILTPSVFGQYSMIAAIVGVAAVLGDFGLSLAALRAPSLSPALSSALFWINVLIGLALATVVFLGSPAIAAFYGEPQLVGACRLMAVVFLVKGASVQYRAEVNRGLRLGVLALVDVGAQLCGALVAIVLAVRGVGLWALVAQQVAAAVATLVVLQVVAGWAPGLPRRVAGLRSCFSFGAATVGTQVVNYASSNVDSVVMGRFWGAEELGVYGRAFQLFILPLQQLVTPLTRVALPLLAGVEDRRTFREHLERAHLALLYAVLPVLAFLAATAQDVIRTVLGDQWAGGAVYLQILLVGGVFQVMGYVYYWAFLARARMRLLLVYEGVGRIAMIGLILLAAPVRPVLIAVAFSTGLALVWLATTAFGARHVDLEPGRLVRQSARPVLLAGAIFLGAAAVIALLPDPVGPVPALGVTFAVSCVVAVAISRAPGFRTDLAALRTVVRSSRSGEQI